MDGSHNSAPQCGQVVTLGIDNEVFAVAVERVREILDLVPITRLPNAPAYLLGLIDVRGRGVPVIDLRLKLGLQAASHTLHTRILVLQCVVAGRPLDVGLMADRVYEVTELDSDETSPPPDMERLWHSDYIERIGRHGEHFVIVLDVGRLFAEEVVLLQSGPPC
ncbi:MAG: chemotaxis protein CheW [Bacteroidales bacterium]